MNSKSELQTQIATLEDQLKTFKEQLKNYKVPSLAEASVGDTLDDGSIVLKKSNGIALLVAPKGTEVRCSWSKEFPEVYKKLKEEELNPSQWFIPTIEQLKLAHKVIPQEFSSTFYWSSAESDATLAYRVYFNLGTVSTGDKADTFCVRVFRCVNY